MALIDGLGDGFFESGFPGQALPSDFSQVIDNDDGGIAFYAEPVGGSVIDRDVVVDLFFPDEPS